VRGAHELGIAAAIGLLLVLTGPAASGGGNRVQNGEFDTDVGGWEPSSSAEALWTEMNAGPPEPSGSVRVTTLGSKDATEGVSQCIEIEGGRGALVEVSIFVPSLQTLSAAALILQWWDEPDCAPTATSLGTIMTTPIQSDDGVLTDEWVPLDNELSVPEGLRSASVLLGVQQLSVGPPGHAYFDSVFVPEPGAAGARLGAMATVACCSALRARGRRRRAGSSRFRPRHRGRVR